MRFRRRRTVGAAGFSLIETLVALLVAGLALTAIAGVFGGGLLGHQASDGAAAALSLAEGQIASAGAAEALAPRRSEGVFAGRFHWQLTIVLYDDPERQAGAGFLRPEAGLRLYRIRVAVDWREGPRQRQLALATLRLAPPPP